MRALFDRLKQEAEDYFRSDSHMANAEITYEGRIDLRYLGQEHSVTVPVEIAAATIESILADFHDAHEKTYTFRLDDTPVEFVTYRLAASAKVPRPELKKFGPEGRSLAAALKNPRTVDFSEDGQHEAAVYERDTLPAGSMLEGPLIVEEATSTTLVHPSQHLRVDEFGFLHITNV